MRNLLLILLLSLLAFAASGRRPDRTTRGKLRPVPVTDVAVADTVMCADSMIAVAGYDKPLRSRFETVFITNQTSRFLEKAELTLRYTDMQGRQLHEVTRWIRCDIPSGETRMVTFTSWDRQFSFYYHLTRPPRTPSVTPYDVSCTPRRLILSL